MNKTIKNVLLISATVATAGGIATTTSASEVWGVGDSTSVGWDGRNNVKPFIETTASDLGAYSNNWHTKSGSSIQNDMAGLVNGLNGDKYHTRANNIVVNLGVNDVNYGNQNINYVSEEYRARLTDLKAKNPQATITVMMSQGDWLNGGNNATVRGGGYSLDQLQVQQRKIANDMKLNVVERGVVTDANHSWKLGDGTVHPTASTYVEIGHKVAGVIKSNPVNKSVYTSYTIDRLQKTGYISTLVGWRWLENGRAYTGIRNYMGAYYYFENGVRKNNQWVNMWGRKYYVGSDGRTVQGWQTIDGKRYWFGNDNTFFLR